MDDDGPPPGEEEEYVDALGVIAALERTCELEARLRQAIQDTHPLTTTLDWDFNAADREREGLLAIRCAAQAGVASRGSGVRCRRRRQPPPARAVSAPLLRQLSQVCSLLALPVRACGCWHATQPRLQLAHWPAAFCSLPRTPAAAALLPTAARISLPPCDASVQRAAGVPGGQAAGVPLPGAR